jgi:hypothetical protein
MADLPEWPRDVIDQWLLPYAESEGWPPALLHSTIPENRWRFLLGGRSVQHFQRLRWHLRQEVVTAIEFCPSAQGVVGQMPAGAFLGATNAYTTGLPRLRVGIEAALSQLAAGQLLRRPILEQHSGGLAVLDGYHRLCALPIAPGKSTGGFRMLAAVVRRLVLRSTGSRSRSH